MTEGIGKYRKFEDYHEEMRSFFAKEHFEAFKSLESIDERILFVANLPACPAYPIRRKINGSKNLEEATIMKNRGNSEFQKTNYDKAFRFYSQALLRSSKSAEFSELLPILYANRSAASFYLTNYDVAIKDIDTSLKNGYPAELCYKLFIRKVKCLIALRKYNEALVVSKLLENALKEAKLSIKQKEKFEDDLRVMLLTNETKTTSQDCEEEQKYTIWTNEKRNSKYESLISKIEIKFSADMGRFAEANTEIEAGRIILQEDAYCAVLLKNYCSTCCYHCFKRVQALYPCPTCDVVIFCSEKCANLAVSSYHQIECPILETLWDSNLSVTCLMALRIITQQKLEDLRAKKDIFCDSEKSPSHKYNSYDYQSVYHLVSHEGKRKPEDILNRIYVALFLMRCLKHTSYFQEDHLKINNQENTFPNQELALEDDEFYITRLLLHHLQILQFNAHEVSELQIQRTNDECFSSEFIGGGLYPTLALFNHSCCPTVVRYFDGTKVIVRTVRNIRAGEMVTENYGPTFVDMSKEKRQTVLMERYWFTCTCEACTNDWPTLKEMNEMNYLPLRCNNKSCYATIAIDRAQCNFLVKCGTCSKTRKLLKLLKELQETDAMLKDGENLLKAKKINEAVSRFLWVMKQLEQILVLPVKEYCICQQHLHTCYLMEGNSFNKY